MAWDIQYSLILKTDFSNKKNEDFRRQFQSNLKMGMSSKDDGGESGSVEVILPDGFGSSFSTKEIRAKVQCLYNQNLFA